MKSLPSMIFDCAPKNGGLTLSFKVGVHDALRILLFGQ